MNLLKIERHYVESLRENEQLYKELEQLYTSIMGDELYIVDNSRVIICRDSETQKLIGMCCISLFSPAKNFTNENNGTTEVPYLYNYVCDPDFKDKKPSHHIMRYIKILLSLTYKEMNLLADKNNTHAIDFYRKNDFYHVGVLVIENTEYNMYTCII